MAQRDPSKTEKATPKRRKKARGKGNVPKSQELTKALTILAGSVGLLCYIDFLAKDMQTIFRHFLGNAFGFNPNQQNVIKLLMWLAG